MPCGVVPGTPLRATPPLEGMPAVQNPHRATPPTAVHYVLRLAARRSQLCFINISNCLLWNQSLCVAVCTAAEP